MSDGARPSAAAMASGSGAWPLSAGSCGSVKVASPLSASRRVTSQEIGPTFPDSRNFCCLPPLARASATAAPTVGWPANGNSLAGVKMRKLGAMRLVGRRQHKHRLRKIEFARDRLHRGGVKPVGVENDRERIAGEALRREDIERDKTPAHAAPQPASPSGSASNIWLGLTNSSCASTSRISREPASAVRCKHAEHRRGRPRQRLGGRAGAQIMREEQRRDRIARAIELSGSRGVRTRKRRFRSEASRSRHRPASPRCAARSPSRCCGPSRVQRVDRGAAPAPASCSRGR